MVRERTEEEKQRILGIIDKELHSHHLGNQYLPPTGVDIDLSAAQLTQFLRIMASTMVEEIMYNGDWSGRYMITKRARDRLVKEHWTEKIAQEAIDAMFDHADYLSGDREDE